MQFQVPTAMFVFLGSYLPLAIILAVQDISSEWWRRPICSWGAMTFDGDVCNFVPFSHPVLATIPIIIAALAVFLSKEILSRTKKEHPIEIRKHKPVPNEIINYTFPYVVSFTGISYETPEKLLGFFVFLCWMFAITYKSGQIMMNPLLLIFNWKIYEATIVAGDAKREVETLILHKGALKAEAYKAEKIQNFYIIQEEDDDK